MKKKRVGIWVSLLILPFVLLILVAGIQFAVRFSTRNSCPDTVQSSSSGELSGGAGLQVYDSTTNLQEVNDTATECSAKTANVVVNLFSVLIGIVAILMMLAAPLWIVMLIRASNYNNKLSKLPPAAPTAPQPPTDSGPPHYPLVG